VRTPQPFVYARLSVFRPVGCCISSVARCRPRLTAELRQSKLQQCSRNILTLVGCFPRCSKKIWWHGCLMLPRPYKKIPMAVGGNTRFTLFPRYGLISYNRKRIPVRPAVMGEERCGQIFPDRRRVHEQGVIVNELACRNERA